MVPYAVDRVVHGAFRAVPVVEIGCPHFPGSTHGSVGPIEAGDSVHETRRRLDGFAEFQPRHRRVAKERVGENLVELGYGAFVIVGGKFPRIERVGMGQADQHLRGDGALVALHQVEVARRQTKLLGHRGLRQVLLTAQALEARPDEQFSNVVHL